MAALVLHHEITARYAEECFRIDAECGALVWNVRPEHHFHSIKYCKGWNARHANRRAGTSCKHGYIAVSINKKFYLAHRLVWLMESGAWPEHEIDHVNGIRSDNRISNLRECTRQENCRNTGMRSDNKSGHCGVWWDARRGRWQAYIKSGPKRVSLGRFDSFEEAATARKQAEEERMFSDRHGTKAAVKYYR